ncbi:MAG: cupin domain-containing protein [Myxococcales bacterium]|nr:cupin domain-containing protein [Myxococcales bacterium]MCB9717412.1 cupin domain-containing protein [Myxococcales bacterium]
MSDETFDEGVLEFLAGGLRPLTAGGLRERLLGSAGGKARFLPFLDRMMAMFDLPEPEAQEHLHSIDDHEAWDDMLPGVRFRDFDGGPALGDAHGGLVRLQPGEAFPHHSHVGEERILILQGEVEDDEGRRYRAGDVLVSADGSSHEMRAVGDREAIYASVVIGLVFTGDGDDDDDDDDG